MKPLHIISFFLIIFPALLVTGISFATDESNGNSDTDSTEVSQSDSAEVPKADSTEVSQSGSAEVSQSDSAVGDAGSEEPKSAENNENTGSEKKAEIPEPEKEKAAVDEAEDPALELLEHIDDLFRGNSSVAVMRMEIRTERWERSLRMRAWSKGSDRSLVRLLDPPRERGVSTLRVEGDLWNYMPNIDRTIKVPAGMMSASWMGSHFTNDDLVQETRYSEDYDIRTASTPDQDPEGIWVIEMIPRPRAPVVWGKVVTEIRDEDRLPVETRFYDEHDKLMRTMTYTDPRETGDRRIPTRIRISPEGKPREFTEMIYEEISFDVDIPNTTFSIQSLRQ